MSEIRPRLTLADVIRQTIERQLSQIHIAMPGRVRSYDATEQTADIELGFMRIDHADGQREVESYPILPAVPVQFPRGGGYALSYPLKKDDPVMVVFNDHPLEQWRAKGAVTDPGDTRRNSLAGAVCIPGIGPNGEALASASDTDMRVGKDNGAHITIRDNGDVDVKSEDGRKVNLADASDALALASKCNSEHADIKSALENLQVVIESGSSSGTYSVESKPGTAYSDSDVDASDVRGS